MTTPTDQACALLAAGRAAEAVALLAAAGDRGDVDALMQHAVWRLTGEAGARDLAEGRALLARAVAIGHVDAALMEVALTANGSGGPADWARALRLLEVAAPGDPVAAAQLALVRAMPLGADGHPAALPPARILAAEPDVRLFPGFLTRPECLHLAQTGDAVMAPAQVVDPASGRLIAHPVRTAWEGVIGPAREDLAVRAINLRVAAASGTDVAQGEPLTVLRYAPGQQYRPHHDALSNVANQRGWTMLLYLNEGYGGGETVFPHAKLTVRGRIGDALLFRNTDGEGRPLAAALHAGQPVTAGHKWLATRWIRRARYDPWNPA